MGPGRSLLRLLSRTWNDGHRRDRLYSRASASLPCCQCGRRAHIAAETAETAETTPPPARWCGRIRCRGPIFAVCRIARRVFCFSRAARPVRGGQVLARRRMYVDFRAARLCTTDLTYRGTTSAPATAIERIHPNGNPDLNRFKPQPLTVPNSARHIRHIPMIRQHLTLRDGHASYPSLLQTALFRHLSSPCLAPPGCKVDSASIQRRTSAASNVTQLQYTSLESTATSQPNGMSHKCCTDMLHGHASSRKQGTQAVTFLRGAIPQAGQQATHCQNDSRSKLTPPALALEVGSHQPGGGAAPERPLRRGPVPLGKDKYPATVCTGYLYLESCSVFSAHRLSGGASRMFTTSRS